MTKEKMTREKKKPNRLTKALLETARDMRRGELLDDAAYAKITMRHLGENEVPKAEPITGEEIRALLLCAC
jgi:putative transcriptional regulator